MCLFKKLTLAANQAVRLFRSLLQQISESRSLCLRYESWWLKRLLSREISWLRICAFTGWYHFSVRPCQRAAACNQSCTQTSQRVWTQIRLWNTDMRGGAHLLLTLPLRFWHTWFSTWLSDCTLTEIKHSVINVTKMLFVCSHECCCTFIQVFVCLF